MRGAHIAVRGGLWPWFGDAECPFVNLPNSVGETHRGEGIAAEDMKTLRWVKVRLVVEVAFTEDRWRQPPSCIVRGAAGGQATASSLAEKLRAIA